MNPVLVTFLVSFTTLTTAAAGVAGFQATRALGEDAPDSAAAAASVTPVRHPIPDQWVNVTVPVVVHARSPACAGDAVAVACGGVAEHVSTEDPVFRVLALGRGAPLPVELHAEWSPATPAPSSLGVTVHLVGSGDEVAAFEGAAPLQQFVTLPRGDYEVRVSAPEGVPVLAQTDVHFSVRGPVERPW